MKDFWKFIKSSGIYFVGSVLTKLVSFFLLPLYTSYISPAGYGIYDLYNSYIMFFCSVLFLDIWMGIMRFMYEHSGEDKKKPINCGMVIFICSSVLYAGLLYGMAPLLDIDNPLILLACGLLMNVQSLVGYIVRGYGKDLLYAGSGLIGSIVTTIFNVILLVYCNMDYNALFVASSIGYVVNIFIMICGLKEPHMFSLKYFDKKLFKEMLRFSLPLCLNSVAYWFLTSYDRIVVNEVLGPEANGYYAVAGRFGSMITLFTGCFHMAWQELAYSKSSNEQELGEFYTVAINSYIKSMGIGLLALIPIIAIIYPVMVNDSYNLGKDLIPIYLLGTILSAIGTFLGHIFSAIKKNQLQFWTMLAGSIANVLCIHLLIIKLGIQASNIALSLGFFVLVITRLVFLRRELCILIESKSIIVIVLLFGVVTYIYQNGSIFANIVVLLFIIILAMLVFKDFIGTILNIVLSKIKKGRK